MSMLGLNTLFKLSKYLQKILSDSRPFGGLGVVLCGDFFQLPPVQDSALYTNGKNKSTGKVSEACIVGLHIYNYIKQNVVILDVVKRTDNKEYAILQEKVRLGTWDENDIKTINNQVDATLLSPNFLNDGDMDYDYQPTAVVKNITRHGIYMSMMVHITEDLYEKQKSLPIVLYAKMTVIPRKNKITKIKEPNNPLSNNEIAYLHTLSDDITDKMPTALFLYLGAYVIIT